MATVSSAPRTTTFTTVSTTAGPFNITFRLFDTDSLDVYLDGVRTTAFTIAATFSNGYTDSATLTLTTAVASGTQVIIDGALTPQRGSDYLNDASLTRNVNIELARLWSTVSEVKRDSERSLRGFSAVDPDDDLTPAFIAAIPGYAASAAASASAAQAVIGGAGVFITPQQNGAEGDGIADETAALLATFQAGGDIYIPEGTYRIAGAGSDAGGVYATITKSLRVMCHPNAKFVADDLDNDMIRLSVPSNGAGLPADGITVEWHGGYFDQTTQKVSTVVPFPTEYPPPSGLAGASATAEALAIYGYYEASSVEYSGIKRAVVSGVTTYAGDHWQTAGGDCGIFVGGCEEQIVKECTNIGNRDTGIYMSGGAQGLLRCRATVENNLAINCFHAVTVKRSADFARIVGNHSENCVRGFLVDKLVGNGHNGLMVSGNTGNKNNIFVRMTDTTDFSVCENRFTNIGALLEDGTTVVTYGDSYGIGARDNCSRGIVSANTISGRTAGLETAFTAHLGALYTEATSSFIAFRDNLAFNLRILGTDEGDYNIFIDNLNYDPVTAGFMTLLGTGAYEQRRNATTNAPEFMHPVVFESGTVSAPAIQRRGNSDTGIYFDTNTVHIGAGGVNRASFALGAVSLNIPSYEDNAAAVSGGLPVDALYHTAAGELRIVV